MHLVLSLTTRDTLFTMARLLLAFYELIVVVAENDDEGTVTMMMFMMNQNEMFVMPLHANAHAHAHIDINGIFIFRIIVKASLFRTYVYSCNVV